MMRENPKGLPLNTYKETCPKEYKSTDKYEYKIDLTLEENQLLEEIHHANYHYDLVNKCIEKGLFIKKFYMSEDALQNSDILKILLKNVNTLKVRLNFDINDIVNILTYLLLTTPDQSNTFRRLPDKRIGYMSNTVMQQVHDLMFFLQVIFNGHIKIETDFENRYYTFTIDKNFFAADPLIQESAKYLAHRYIKRINPRSKKVQRRYMRFYKEHKFIPFNKLDKRKNLYYENSMFNEVTARVCFKEIALGFSWYYSQLTDKYYIPKSLQDIRDKNGTRDDVYYIYTPVDMLCNILKRDGKDVVKRLHSTIRGMRGFIKPHKLSYENIVNPNQEMDFQRKEEYQELKLLKHGKLKKENNEIVKNEQYMARIQGFKVSSFNYIVFADYLETSIGKFILENRDVYYYIIKKYLVENQNLTIEEYAKRFDEYNINAELVRYPLTTEQIQELLDGPLASIDLDDPYLRSKANKLLDRDKIRSLPKVEAIDHREYSYNDCMKKDHNGNFIYDKIVNPTLGEISKKIKKKDPTDCIFILQQVTKRLTSVKDVSIFDGSDLKAIKKYEEYDLNIINSLEIKEAKKYDQYDLGYNLKQFNLVMDHVVTGFKKVGRELDRFINQIKDYGLSNLFYGREEALPYMKMLL